MAQWQCCSTLSAEREKEKTFKCSGVALSIKWKKQIWHQMLSRLSDTYKWICTFNLKTLFLSTYILLRGLMRSCTGPRLIFFLSIFSLGPTFNYQLTLNLPTVIWLLRLSDLATLSVHKCVYNLLSPNIWRLFGMDFRSMSKHCTFQSYSKVSNHLASWCRRNWKYLQIEKLKNSFQSLPRNF